MNLMETEPQEVTKDETQETTQDPEWIVVMSYQNLPGCPSFQRAICD